MPIKTITVLREYKLDVPWNWGSHEKKFEFIIEWDAEKTKLTSCLLYTSPSPRDRG